MKMVKSLLLGSAAGLVAVAGAQAADLPVKAKPVQYVKICSLYGVGFYYIPGTDMCLKIGGWTRAEYAYDVNGSSVTSQIGNVNARGTNNMWWRVRGYITADARNQTEYGTVRGYIAVGVSTNSTGQTDNAANQFDANRAFIQWAGFTFGRTVSFYDFYSAPAVGFLGFAPGSDAGDGGVLVAMYTAQFGNGFSATLGAEMRRQSAILNLGSGGGTSINALNAGFSTAGQTITGTGSYGGYNSPDFVGNLRVDQAWGSAQIMGAMHLVNATYYGNAAGATTGLENNGHPSDKWGYAVGAGIRLNAPMIAPGDYFQTQVNYAAGATKYVFQNPASGPWYLQRGQNAGFGIVSDAVYGGTNAAGATSGTDLQLTTAWGVNASYEHFWNRQWKTSLYGGYAEMNYNSTANALLCSSIGSGNGSGAGTAATATAGCDMDWSSWWLGSRTQWNITPDFYMGLDVMYLRLRSASLASSTLPATLIPTSTATTGQAVSDEGIWAVRFRVHKDFYP